MNIAVVRGTLSSDPRIKELPSGSTLASLELTVRTEGQPSESVPVSWFDPAGPLLGRCRAGTELLVVGRVRRRFYRTAGGTASGTASATEVLAEHVVAASSRARVGRLLGEAAARLVGPDPTG